MSPRQFVKPLGSSSTTSRHYDRIRVLGKGSFGTATVHRKRDDCSLVVHKEIDLLRFRGEREKLSALNEARIMSTLSHPNIIKYHNAYTTDTKLIIEMEYASVGTLTDYLASQDGPLEEQEIVIIFRQITLGLEYLHSKNIVHLDLKTANIFLTIEGFVKIGDFGIAQYMNNENELALIAPGVKSPASSHMSTTNNLGTLAYSSPERCLGGACDFKSDIWSLGCILYELIVGSPLFYASCLSDLVLSITRIAYKPIRRKVMPALEEIFERMIAKHPADRPSAEDLLNFSEQLLSRIQLRGTNRRLPAIRANHKFELSTELEVSARTNEESLRQISYPHSLVYQVRLNSSNVQVERVKLPQTKRIKEIAKGRSHYLMLTYDNIVYGWGSMTFGQLGTCGLSTGKERDRHTGKSSSGVSSVASSVASSTQTIVSQRMVSRQNQMSKQMIIDKLKDSQWTSKPFIINELNHRKIVQVAAGKNFSVFLGKTGIVMTCGDGSAGCLGRGNFVNCFSPCMVESLLSKDVVSIGCGPKHVIAVCGNGRVYAWGKNRHGRLGIENSNAGKFVMFPHLVKFPDEIFIKSVSCGDRCTIFIDSDNRCWACGENTNNKLGFDIKRRFKKTITIDGSQVPEEIIRLSKHRIVSCSIGKNHSSFITAEGKLIVFGQDLDRGQTMYNDIRETTNPKQVKEVQERPITKSNSYRQLSQLSQYIPRSYRFMKSSSNIQLEAESEVKEKQIVIETETNSPEKRSRSKKKMPFECVIGVSCAQKFSLVLTNDNRVYFWGTRSYKKEFSKHSDVLDKNFRQPQLVPSCLDDCFIKIGKPNSSLMSSIEALGSDQPIINAQDPRLVAKNLSDLWILDYRPAKIDGFRCDSWSHSGSSESSKCSLDLSCCSLCHSCSNSSLSSSSLLSGCSCQDCFSQELDGMKHDAILEPQPIVSLYVPSMFNHSSCTLHLVDLFCFDQDKFYLILDTTVKMQQQLHEPRSGLIENRRASAVPIFQQNSASAKCHRVRLNSLSEVVAQLTNTSSTNLSTNASSKNILMLDGLHQAEDTSGQLTEDEQFQKLPDELNPEQKADKSSDDNNNENAIISSLVSSQGVVGSEEPRSVSTFATCIENHINEPQMRTIDILQQVESPQHIGFHPSPDSLAISDENSFMRSTKTVRALKLGTREPGSYTGDDLDETSSMPSWVKNEYIQYQKTDSGGIFAIESSDDETCVSVTTDSQSDNSVRIKDMGNIESLKHLANTKQLSRSHPEVRELYDLDPGALDRRASIVDETLDVNQNRPNLLDCEVYKGTSTLQCDSSNFRSSFSSANRSQCFIVKGLNSESCEQKAQVCWQDKQQAGADYRAKETGTHIKVSKQASGSSSVERIVSNLSLASLRKSLVRLFS